MNDAHQKSVGAGRADDTWIWSPVTNGAAWPGAIRVPFGPDNPSHGPTYPRTRTDLFRRRQLLDGLENDLDAPFGVVVEEVERFLDVGLGGF